MSYIVGAAILSLALGSHALFVGLTSYIHYGIYIATYYHQATRSCAFEAFKKTVMYGYSFMSRAYKTVAMFHLAYYYLSGVPTLSSLFLIAAGFGTSASAMYAIGVDATYFGIELGRLNRKEAWVETKWPYTMTQHPMILGNLIGLFGVGIGCSESAPFWLVPGHMALYVLHMTQEHFQVFEERRELKEE